MHLTAAAFSLAVFLLADRPPDPASLPAPPEPLRSGFAAIDEAELRYIVGFLASDELEGRDTGRRGYDVAARFAASVFERYGAQPAGDGGGWFQDSDGVRSEADPEASGIEVKDGAGTERLGIEHLGPAAWGAQLDWKVPWTCVGSGNAAEKDAPGDFKGVPVAERVVLVVPPADRKEHEARAAVAAGATRIAVVSDARVTTRQGLHPFDWPAAHPWRPPSGGPEIVFISRRAADRILKSKDLTVEKIQARKDGPGPIALDGVEVKLAIKRKETKFRIRNVVARVEGSDPARKAQAVVVGAHLDHVGLRGTEICHGADDNASGSAGVLAVARAFAGSPRRPARSVLLVLFAGEERGFWGSSWFVEHPPIPLKSMVAEIQLDMIGRNEEHRGRVKAEDNTNTVHVIGSRRRSLDLDRLIVADNRFLGLDLKSSGEMYYGGSDHVQFGERGVPVAFFFTGDHPDYHQPSDTADKINYAKMARIARLSFAVAYDLADRTDPLRPVRRF